MLRLRRLTLLIAFSLASPGLAGEFRLKSPIDCEIGEGKRCYIQYYPDTDPTEGISDFACGSLSYNTHKGTDFALRDLDDLETGVNVVAAAAGIVRGVRDGMPDQVLTPQNENLIDGRDCGNGVVITHNDGWETQYCHLRRGSVQVQSGQKVDAGTVLGLVGLSGRTQFPHVHVSVRKDGQQINPMRPDAQDSCDPAPRDASLWDSPPVYQPGGLISVGFSDRIPNYDDIKKGRAAVQDMNRQSPALVVWGFAFGAHAGDILRLSIIGPNGASVYQSDTTLEKSQPQLFRAGGRKTKNADWFTPGIFGGRVEHIRDGAVISAMTTSVTVLPDE